MALLLRMTIVSRLRVAYFLFLLPIVFLFLAIWGNSSQLIATAQKEVAGVHYAQAVFAVQDALAGLGDDRHGALADKIDEAVRRFGAGMDTGAEARALVTRLREPNATVAALRPLAMALIGKIADGSGLTLDTDLDSFYVMDVVTGKIPGLGDALLELTETTREFAGRATLTPEDQTRFLLADGHAKVLLDGMTASLETAFKANRSGATKVALGAGLMSAAAATKTALANLDAVALTRREQAGQASAVASPA